MLLPPSHTRQTLRATSPPLSKDNQVSIMQFFRIFSVLLLSSLSLFAENEPGWAISKRPTHEQATAWFPAASARSSSVSATGTVSKVSASAPTTSAPVAAQIAALTSFTAGGNEADQITTEISDLARGLSNNPIKIFEYVYNHIEFEAYFGSKKGAHLTLLEGSGNEFDQCALLVALLRAANLNPSYHYGPCQFYYNELVSWMGLSATPYDHLTDAQFASQYGITDTSASNIAYSRRYYAVKDLLLTRGYFYVQPYVFDGVDFGYSIPHVWVEITLDGITRTLSPSFKTYTDTTGLSLATAMEYSRAQTLADAAGTTGTPDWVSGLNYTSISSRLNIYTQNFLAYLKNNSHSLSVGEVVGNRVIDVKTFDDFTRMPVIYPDLRSASVWLPFETWSAIPVDKMSKVRLIAGIYDYTNKIWTTTYLDQQVNMPALQGRKISLSFSGDSGRIYLDETLLEAAFSLPGTTVDLGIEATHNHYELTPNTYVVRNQGKSDQKEVKSYIKGDTFAYAIIYSFSNPDKIRCAREEILDGYRRAGLAESDWRVKTEILNIMGLNWLYQTWQVRQQASPLFNTLPLADHRFGRMAQEQSYYIDVGLQLGYDASRSSNYSLGTSYNHFTSLISSAMEHGVIEQLQGEDKSAASTVKMVYLANQLGLRNYRATGANWSSVNALLTGYPATAITQIQTSVLTRSGIALLPSSGNIPLGQWHGAGYAIEEPANVLMAISGGYLGGYNSQSGSVTLAPVVNQAVSDPAYSTSSSTTTRPAYTPLTTPQMASNEPIDMASGAYFLDKTDLELGGQSAPRGLAFSRHYNSNRSYDKSAGLGYGWTHNYDISITKRSSVKAGLGETISYHSAPFLVGMLVASDLYSNNANAKEWASSALAVQWAVDQLKYNAAAVTMGNKTIEFIKMPDGTYAAPAGMNLTLTVVGGNFQLTERHGSTMAFNSAGKLATITDLYGKVQTFTYAGSQLSSVGDAWGRTLTFNWASSKRSALSQTARGARWALVTRGTIRPLARM